MKVQVNFSNKLSWLYAWLFEQQMCIFLESVTLDSVDFKAIAQIRQKMNRCNHASENGYLNEETNACAKWPRFQLQWLCQVVPSSRQANVRIRSFQSSHWQSYLTLSLSRNPMIITSNLTNEINSIFRNGTDLKWNNGSTIRVEKRLQLWQQNSKPVINGL